MNQSLPLPRHLTQRIVRTARLTWREFLGDRCFDKSAALAYVSLMGVFAVMAVLLWFTSIFFQGERFQENREEMLGKVESFILSKVLPQVQETEFHPPMAPELYERQQVRVQAEQMISQAFHDLVGMFDDFHKMASGLGVLGLLGMIVVSMMLFTSVEKGFNAVFHVRRKRHLARTLITYMGVIVWAAVLIAAALVLVNQVTDWLVVINPSLMTFTVTCLIFAMSYWLIPNTRVSPIAAIAGGIFAGLVWDVSKDVFVLYLLSFPNVRNLLPILGVLPIFLLWLYTTWLVVFLGLEFTYVLQHYSPLAGRLYHSDEALDLNPRHLLAALYELGRHLNEGDPLTTVAQLMRATQQDEYQVHALLDHCESKGWVVASEPHAVYQLARPAEQIALSEVLVSPVTLLPGAPTSIHPGPLEEFWRSHHDSATSALPLKTLRELLCMSSGPADKARQAVGRQADAP